MALLGRGKSTKKAKAKKAGPSRRERFGQMKQAWVLTRKADGKMLPLVAGSFLLTVAVFTLLGVLLSHPVAAAFLGVVFGTLVAAAVFGRRVQRAAYSQVEGQLGAAAAVLQNMRGNWRVTPAVGFTKEQDLVHRVIGRPGVVLVGEGNPARVRQVIGAQKRSLSRIVGETPIYDVVVGDGEGQVGLRELEKHLNKLPQNIKPAVVNSLNGRLKAMGGAAMPIPKGPMPTRVPRGKVR